MLMLNLEEELQMAQRDIPSLVPHIERLMTIAKTRYQEAGFPYGEGDAHAYAWFQEQLAAYNHRKALQAIDAQAREVSAQRIAEAVASGLITQVDVNTIKYTPKGVAVWTHHAMTGYLDLLKQRPLTLLELETMQTVLARGVLMLDEPIRLARTPVPTQS